MQTTAPGISTRAHGVTHGLSRAGTRCPGETERPSGQPDESGQEPGQDRLREPRPHEAVLGPLLSPAGSDLHRAVWAGGVLTPAAEHAPGRPTPTAVARAGRARCLSYRPLSGRSPESSICLRWEPFHERGRSGAAGRPTRSRLAYDAVGESSPQASSARR